MKENSNNLEEVTRKYTSNQMEKKTNDFRLKYGRNKFLNEIKYETIENRTVTTADFFCCYGKQILAVPKKKKKIRILDEP